MDYIGPHLSVAKLQDARELFVLLLDTADIEDRREYAHQINKIDEALRAKSETQSLSPSIFGSSLPHQDSLSSSQNTGQFDRYTADQDFGKSSFPQKMSRPSSSRTDRGSSSFSQRADFRGPSPTDRDSFAPSQNTGLSGRSPADRDLGKSSFPPKISKRSTQTNRGLSSLSRRTDIHGFSLTDRNVTSSTGWTGFSDPSLRDRTRLSSSQATGTAYRGTANYRPSLTGQGSSSSLRPAGNSSIPLTDRDSSLSSRKRPYDATEPSSISINYDGRNKKRRMGPAPSDGSSSFDAPAWGYDGSAPNEFRSKRSIMDEICGDGDARNRSNGDGLQLFNGVMALVQQRQRAPDVTRKHPVASSSHMPKPAQHMSHALPARKSPPGPSSRYLNTSLPSMQHSPPRPTQYSLPPPAYNNYRVVEQLSLANWNPFPIPQNYPGPSFRPSGSASRPVEISSDEDSGPSDRARTQDSGLSDHARAQPTHSNSFEDEMHERGLSGLMADPSRAREDIQKLLENIRPDEELPEELRQDTPVAMSCPLMPHQRVGLAWLKKLEESSHKGGILADAMGLGKTVQAIALMLARPPEEPSRKTTLIVVPLALLKQWPREIDQKIKPGHKLKVLTFYGNKKKMSISQLMTYDVVVTNYDTLSCEYSSRKKWEEKRESNPALPAPHLVLLDRRAKFHRIILDEAHKIKNRSTQSSLAATEIDATYRLCMTGTPLQNGVEELFPLIRFLRIKPYNNWDVFNRQIFKTLKSMTESGASRDYSVRRLHALLKSTLLQRTKSSTIDGRPIIQLPPRTNHTAAAAFDEDQLEFYKALQEQTQLKVNKYLKAGTIGKNYQNVLVLLLRLRQACCHPALIKDHGIPAGAEADSPAMVNLAEELDNQVVTRLKDQLAFDCPVCLDVVPNPTIFSPCGHKMCGECFSGLIENSKRMEVEAKCPECRGKLDPEKVFCLSHFLQAHMPEKYQEEYLDNADMLNDYDSDSESSDEEDDADDVDDVDDVDDQGNLQDFVVPNNDDSDYEASDEDSIVRQNISKGKKASSRKPIDKKAKGKSNAKAKGKAVKKNKAKQGRKFQSMAESKKQGMRNAKAKRRYWRRLEKDYTSSAKIEKTMELLESIYQNDSQEKTIIFSQWTSFLDLVEIPISRKGYSYCRYDGSISAEMRDNIVTEFSTNPDVKVMLISLRAGNAGLNLNVASQVIILDPFWNPSIEEQAIDRAHRIGQQRPVHVHRVLIASTVEDRILELQERKQNMVNEALSEEGGKSISRLGIGDLRYLFGL